MHAFYVPPPSGPSYDDNGYSGPLQGTTGLPFSSAKGVFHTNWLSSGSFNPPAPLTELWSFIPPGQLTYLYSNDAMVDSSPAVIDVFGDLDGDGIREWHTLLIASAGGANRELFALDVTNPLAIAAKRHSGGSNYVYADGHAKWRRFEQTRLPFSDHMLYGEHQPF